MDVIYWRFVFRCCTTEFFRAILVNKQSAGLKDVPAFMERVTLLGSKSLAELSPHMTHLFALGQSEVLRYRISARPAAQLLFFMGKWDRDDMSKISLADFLHEGVVFNWKDHVNDLCISLHALDLYMCTYLGGHWQGVFAHYANEINVKPMFKEFRAFVKCYAVHLILTLAFDDLTAEPEIFNWVSIVTAIAKVRHQFDIGLTREALILIRDTVDFELTNRITYPSDVVVGEHVLAASGDRAAPRIAAPPPAKKIQKRKPQVDPLEVDLFEDPAAEDRSEPKNPKKPKTDANDPKPKNNYCFASLIAGFDLTTLRGSGCTAEGHPSECKRGRHVVKSDLPSVQVVIRALSGYKTSLAQSIVKLLKEKS